jgi:hypothetical protein
MITLEGGDQDGMISEFYPTAAQESFPSPVVYPLSSGIIA